MEEPRLEPRSMGGEAPFIEQVSKLKLIRNAKGDTQIEVSVVAGTTQAEMDEIRQIAFQTYKAATEQVGYILPTV